VFEKDFAICICNVFFIFFELSRNLSNPDLAAYRHLVQPRDKTGHRMSQTLAHGGPHAERNDIHIVRLS
jgi:hypothetical protein